MSDDPFYGYGSESKMLRMIDEKLTQITRTLAGDNDMNVFSAIGQIVAALQGIVAELKAANTTAAKAQASLDAIAADVKRYVDATLKNIDVVTGIVAVPGEVTTH